MYMYVYCDSSCAPYICDIKSLYLHLSLEARCLDIDNISTSILNRNHCKIIEILSIEWNPTGSFQHLS
jgi:hypothetical protein